MKFLLAAPLLGLATAKLPCTQDTVTTTVTQRHTVTIPAISSEAAPISTPAEEPATNVVSTIYVSPSPIPYFPNSTFNASLPTTFSFAVVSSSAASVEDTSAAPAETSAPVPIPTSEAIAVPTSEVAAIPSPSTSPNPAVGDEAALGGTNSGEATFYGGNVAGGTCSFSGYTIPSGILGTALSDSNWASAGNCGACVSVKGPDGNSIKAMVVDQCPGCGNNHLDLFPDAFAKLADPSKGVIPVSWSIVPCDITSPIVLKNKEGTSKYWFSMQVMNSNVPVSKLEVSTDGGKTWQGTTRKEYNFFENPSGFGTDTVDVKVTSVNGGSITVKNCGVVPSSKITASSNFS
ncbi:carbohydrate-binding module family 63 protein [Zopfia rhizophila CBS 207.26]|uniref:Carbohydrate-binding module family 63 protein n=1 Tax=Zopfia rhizophila CBS 207.26 TaxID=1314779 RepID=A0A6A6E417_9PEZI|nr:carbohydrate-binding module family 63 protein [Zopfia rhizophila CBS 207.26]